MYFVNKKAINLQIQIIILADLFPSLRMTLVLKILYSTKYIQSPPDLF